MFKLTRKSGPEVSFAARFAALPVALFALAAASAPAQTAPQLLPYTSVLVAGGGAAATYTVGGTCPVSGYIETDTHGDGCLATEVFLGGTAATPGPRDAIADSAGNVFFSDYQNALIRRVDAITGIVTAVAGGGTTTVAALTSTTLGTAIKLDHPAAVLFAANGDFYFTDPGNGQVFKVASTGGFVGGSVSSVNITSGGSGYTVAPTVTFSAPASGTPATGTATISGGKVTGVTIVTAGSGYTSAPTVTFSAPASGATATGSVATSGVISLVAGNAAGTYGYAASNTVVTNTPDTVTAANSYLRSIYGLAFDNSGDLIIADEYYYAVLGMNLTGSTNTVFNTAIPAGQIWKLAGTSTNATDTPFCINGTASTSGCTDGLYSTYNTTAFNAGTQQANSDEIRLPYAVTVAPNGYLYVPDEYYDSVFKVSSAGILTNFSGTPNTAISYPYAAKALPRGPAGSFSISSSLGITADANSNVYIGDAGSGLIWRVDGAGGSQYAVAGGVGIPGEPATVCTGATDTLGDGCPALSAKIGNSGTASNFATTTLPGPGIYGLHVDANANLFFADTENNDVREIASGTQFGVVGANQPMQTVEIHFANGDMPASSGAYSLTAGSTNFSLGTATCKAANSDGTMDCLLPITATPSVLGTFTGTLQVKSALGGVGAFPLSGVYAQSPNTRTSVSYTPSITCAGTTTYATSVSYTATAIVTANGPAPPVGTADTITFTATNTATSAVTNLGTVAVSNIGTTAAPVYGATSASFTLPTVGTYSISAAYSGDAYFKPSSGTAPNTITSAAASTSLTPVTNQQNTVTAGQTALYSFTITQTVYSGTLSFAVTGLPTNSTYAISPSTITAAGCSTTSTVALSIYTQQQTTVQPGSFASGHNRWSLIAAFAGALLALAIGLRRRRIRFAQLWMALALLLATTGTVACGKAVGSVLQPATPTGTYTITVTATSSVGTSPAPITFQLTVH